MHRDQKIGLSLAVLLIGFAGAFCFRHEPIVHPQSLALDHAAELDLRIEHLPIRAYTEREGVHVPGESPSDTQHIAADGPLSDVLISPLQVADDGDHINLFAGPPEPLRVYSPPPPVVRRRRAASPSVQLPRPSPTPVQPTPVSLPPASHEASMPDIDPYPPAEHIDGQSATPMTTYVVQPGDTLSGIAEKHLGSMVRYQELFEANRDVLANPNALRAGVVLRIPNEVPQ